MVNWGLSGPLGYFAHYELEVVPIKIAKWPHNNYKNTGNSNGQQLQ